MRRARSVAAAFAIAPSLLLGALIWTAPAGAQVTTIETIPPEVDENGRTAGDRVDQIVVTLRVVAGLMLIASGVYWWQTRPDRVVRAAVARGELERATARVEADAAAAMPARDASSPEPESVSEADVEQSGESEPSRPKTSADVLLEVAAATGNGRGRLET